MILWFHSIIFSVLFLLDFLAYVICFPVVNFWGEQMKPKEKKPNRSQKCNSTTAANLQIQTRTGLTIINDIQRNFCNTSAHLKRMPAQNEQTQNFGEEHPSWAESLCSGGRSSPKHLHLLAKICKPATQDRLCPEQWDSSKQDQWTCSSLPAAARRHSPDLWKSHMPHNSECTSQKIRGKKPHFLLQIRNL